MKTMKLLMTMTLAAVALVFGVCSCGSDDDEPEVGEPDQGTKTFVFTKATDTSVDMTSPEYGEGMMSLPALPVKNIMLTKKDNTITGRLASYEGKVINSDGSEKAYSVSDVTVIFNDNRVVVTFTMKYGNMPFAFAGQFTGVKK